MLGLLCLETLFANACFAFYFAIYKWLCNVLESTFWLFQWTCMCYILRSAFYRSLSSLPDQSCLCSLHMSDIDLNSNRERNLDEACSRLSLCYVVLNVHRMAIIVGTFYAINMRWMSLYLQMCLNKLWVYNYYGIPSTILSYDCQRVS